MGRMSLLGRRIYWRFSSAVAQEVARSRVEAGGLFPRSGGVSRPILRNKGSSETCVCIRGHFEEYFYDENGNLTDTIDMVPGGVVLNIEKGGGIA